MPSSERSAHRSPAIDRTAPADWEKALPSRLSVPEAIELAVQCHREGYLDAAEKIYRTVLDAAPDQADALQFLGVLAHQRGDSRKAIELIQRAIELSPEAPGLINNLGNVLYEAERFDEAASAYEKALALAQESADAYSNLGAARRAQGRIAEAEEAYARAIKLEPLHADAHHNMGNLLTGQGRIKEAVTYFCKSITLRPAHAEAKRHLGIAYAMLGRIDEAAEVYRKWLREEPDNLIASHMLAACCGEQVPARAADGYVEEIFDQFARSFDVRLAKLGYRAPQLVCDAIQKTCGPPTKRLTALDAGCGTGLCGPLIEPFVSRLTGVDLSSQMLAKAKARGIYDELVKSELTEYLRAQAGAFDLVISADTLVYFGALEPVFAAAHIALRDAGVLIFTVEHASDDRAAEAGYRLMLHGRYAHSQRYLRGALRDTGFDLITLELAVLRMESGNEVTGMVVTARKSHDAPG